MQDLISVSYSKMPFGQCDKFQS